MQVFRVDFVHFPLTLHFSYYLDQDRVCQKFQDDLFMNFTAVLPELKLLVPQFFELNRKSIRYF